jgi:hypothetical protein
MYAMKKPAKKPAAKKPAPKGKGGKTVSKDKPMKGAFGKMMKETGLNKGNV